MGSGAGDLGLDQLLVQALGAVIVAGPEALVGGGELLVDRGGRAGSGLSSGSGRLAGAEGGRGEGRQEPAAPSHRGHVRAPVYSVRPAAWGHSSVGRALPSHGRGQGFDSPWLHFKQPIHTQLEHLKSKGSESDPAGSPAIRALEPDGSREEPGSGEPLEAAAPLLTDRPSHQCPTAAGRGLRKDGLEMVLDCVS